MPVILAQTDTTVGLLSQDAHALDRVKQRPPLKNYLKIYYNLRAYKLDGRVPNRFKSQLRRSKKISYVVKNSAFRIASESAHQRLLKKYQWLFSTSANRSEENFERSFCESNADIIVEDYRGLFQAQASQIIKLGHIKKRRLR